MEPMKLHFDIRDIFRAPRLALSGKKIWILAVSNIVGYGAYWTLTYLSFLISGFTFTEVWGQYGLYPCVVGDDVNWLSYLTWAAGCVLWFLALALGFTAVSRVTYKQLKGDEFYSSGDAWKFLKKHWHAPVFTYLSISLIAIFFVAMAIVFALIGKIPYLGELFFGIPYLLWFLGSVFVVYTLLVLVVSFFFTYPVVAMLEEDTMGTVFQNYSITWSQPWRLILYLLTTGVLIFIAVGVFGLFTKAGVVLINWVFGFDWLMGDKLHNMIGWATGIVLGNDNSPILWCLSYYEPYTPWMFPLDVNLSPTEYIGGFFIAVSLFIILLTVFSYGLSIKAVSESIALAIFKNKTDNMNLLERKDEEELAAESQEEEKKSSEKDNSSEEKSEESPEEKTS